MFLQVSRIPQRHTLLKPVRKQAHQRVLLQSYCDRRVAPQKKHPKMFLQV